MLLDAAFLDHCYLSFRDRCLKKGIITLSLFSFNSTSHRFKCCSGVKPQATGGDIRPKAAAQTKCLRTVGTGKDPIVHVGKQLGKAA